MPREPAFSRASRVPGMGKNTRRLETLLPDDLAEKVTTIARLHGKTDSEWVRDLIAKTLYGEWGVLRLRLNLTDENTENPR